MADLLNEDLEREYQAIIAYVIYSQVLKGAEYMNIAAQLETHAQQELQHALTISRQIDYLGKMPSAKPKPVKVSDKPREMLQFDLENENETIRNYRTRIRQCEAIGEYALAEQIRQILVQEQDHQIDLANREVPRPTGSAHNVRCSGPHREGEEPKPMMHDRGKSDSAIVAVKPTNNARQPAAEPVEPRAGTKRNAGEQSTHRTQGRARVTQALARVRKAAQQKRKEKFTALFHHLSVDLLREASSCSSATPPPGWTG